MLAIGTHHFSYRLNYLHYGLLLVHPARELAFGASSIIWNVRGSVKDENTAVSGQQLAVRREIGGPLPLYARLVAVGTSY